MQLAEQTSDIEVGRDARVAEREDGQTDGHRHAPGPVVFVKAFPLLDCA